MARLISLTAYMVDSTTYASASVMAVTSDNIISVQNASANFKRSNPSASAQINSRVVVNDELNNAGERHVYGVGETIATIVTASA